MTPRVDGIASVTVLVPAASAVYGVVPATWIAKRRAESAPAPSTTARPKARKRRREGGGTGRPSRYGIIDRLTSRAARRPLAGPAALPRAVRGTCRGVRRTARRAER